jgi:hypothetical protein
VSISSAFDSGNIAVVGGVDDPRHIRLRINASRSRVRLTQCTGATKQACACAACHATHV